MSAERYQLTLPIRGAFFVASGHRGDVWAKFQESAGVFVVSEGYDFRNVIGRANTLEQCRSTARLWLAGA